MTDSFLLNLQSLARIGALLRWAEFLVAVGVIFAVVSFALMLSQLILIREASRDRALAAQCWRRACAHQCDLNEIADEVIEYMGHEDEEADNADNAENARLCGCDEHETERYHRTLSTCVVVQRGEALT